MTLTLRRPNVSSWKFVRRTALVRGVFMVLVIGLTLVPIINMTKLMATTGANSQGNDYLYIVDLLDRVLSGGYYWPDYFRDSFFAGGHSMVIPFGIIFIAARFASLNEYLLISIGLAFTVLRLILLFDVLSYWTTSWLKWILLPILSFLLFANAQISVFGYGFAAVQILISLFGFVLGLWGLIRFSGTWKGTWIAVLGGLIAAWSGGFGIAAWPFLVIGMLLFQFRKPAQYLLWLTVGIIAALPYISFGSSLSVAQPKLLDFSYLLRLIGLPFASMWQDVALQTVGVVGIVSAIPGLFLTWRLRAIRLRRTFPALILLGYSILGTYQITVFREGPSPWYSPISLNFWVAVVGLAVALCVPAAQEKESRASVPEAVWGLGFLGILGYLFLTTNIDYVDKAMLLWARRPVSASCMLYYHTAPTYCEGYIFQYGHGIPELVTTLAEPLERHHLSTFAPHQIWTLQGDFGLSNVQIRETPNIPGIFWTLGDGTQVNRAPWDDFRHLNLFLHTPNKIRWTVKIPSNVEQAAFHSAIAISESVASTEGADGVNFEVSVQSEDGTREVVFAKSLDPTDSTWEPFEVPLQGYAGQTITLHLTSHAIGHVGHDWAMYRFPYIELSLDTARGDTGSTLNLEKFLPSPTENDLRFDPMNWETVNIQSAISGTTWAVGSDKQGAAYKTMDVCLADYTYIYIRMGALAGTIMPRYLEMTYLWEPLEGLSEAALTDALAAANPSIIRIPFHHDGGMDEYYYPVRLFEQDDFAILRGILLASVADRPTEFSIEDFRLIREGTTTSSRCATQ